MVRHIWLVIASNADLAGAVDTAASRGAPSVRAHAQHAVPARILLGTGDRDPLHQPAENRVKSRVNFHPWVCSFCQNFVKLCEAPDFQENLLGSFLGFFAFTLELLILTSISVAPARSVFWCTTQFQQNDHTSLLLAIIGKQV